MRVISLVFMLISLPCIATDKAREQRWIDQTIDTIFDGEAVFLQMPEHRFLSIYMQPEQDSRNGLIVLHGTGFHPNYEQVVRPLRVSLPAQGWHTLSIQLPLLDSDARYNDYVAVYPEVPPRITAAIDFLKTRGVTNVGIVAHSQAATMACYYLATTDNNVVALVAIGMSAQHTQPNINSAESLRKIDIPVLDIYGSKDFPAVLETAQLRQTAAGHNPHYLQSVVDGAFHFFDIREDELIEAVESWLADFKQQ